MILETLEYFKNKYKHYGIDEEALKEIYKKYQEQGFGFLEFDEHVISYCQQHSKKKDENKFLYDIKIIHEDIDIKTFIMLLNLFPKRDIDIFIKYVNLDIKKEEIKSRKNLKIKDNKLNYLHIIENDLKYMYNLYLQDKNVNKVLEHMKEVSLRFRFPALSQKALREKIRTLEEKEQKEVILSHDNSLLGIKTTEFNKTYDSAIKKIARTFKEEKNYKSDFINDLVNEFGIELLKEAVNLLPKLQKESLLLEYGNNLKEDNRLKYKGNNYNHALTNIRLILKKLKLQYSIRIVNNINTEFLVKKYASILPEDFIRRIIEEENSNDYKYLEGVILNYLHNLYNSNPNSIYASFILEFLNSQDLEGTLSKKL